MIPSGRVGVNRNVIAITLEIPGFLFLPVKDMPQVVGEVVVKVAADFKVYF